MIIIIIMSRDFVYEGSANAGFYVEWGGGAYAMGCSFLIGGLGLGILPQKMLELHVLKECISHHLKPNKINYPIPKGENSF